jgi:F-type H+-transporting ATPase subunit alpha
MQESTKQSVNSSNDYILTSGPIEGIHLQATIQADDAAALVHKASAQTVQALSLTPDGRIDSQHIKPQFRSLQVQINKDTLGKTHQVYDLLQKESIDKGSELVLQSVFGKALPINKRGLVNQQLETGVTIIDSLFPVVKGQRIAVIGDAKAGKSSMLSQAAIHHLKNSNSIAVFVEIAKRKQDIEKLAFRLYQAGVMDRSIIVVADALDNIVLQYLAPFVGCALAEHYWQQNDVMVVYDDLATHAKVYREMALQLGMQPGRESYPADLFYVHASLLERAGLNAETGKSLTAFAVATTPNDDLTGYFPTNMISTADGQLVFDLKTMRQGIRPALNIGLSVSRVGGRAQSAYYQNMSERILQSLAAYSEVETHSRFNTKLSVASQKNLAVGRKLFELFIQDLGGTYTLPMQRVMLETIFLSEEPNKLNVSWLKAVIGDVVKPDTKESDYRELAKDLLKSNPEI